MTEFWRENREWLIEYAEEETEVSLSELQSMEDSYREYLEDARQALLQRKAELMQEYSVSEDDIRFDAEEFRDAI